MKKLISVLLAVVMLAGILGVAASAQSTSEWRELIDSHRPLAQLTIDDPIAFMQDSVFAFTPRADGWFVLSGSGFSVSILNFNMRVVNSLPIQHDTWLHGGYTYYIVVQGEGSLTVSVPALVVHCWRSLYTASSAMTDDRVHITSNTGWTITSNSSWIRFRSGNQWARTISGTGNRYVRYMISENPPSSNRRTGSFTVTTDCGESFTVTIRQNSSPARPPWFLRLLDWFLYHFFFGFVR